MHFSRCSEMMQDGQDRRDKEKTGKEEYSIKKSTGYKRSNCRKGMRQLFWYENKKQFTMLAKGNTIMYGMSRAEHFIDERERI